MRRRVIARTANGDYRLRLSAEEREVLRSLPGQLRQMLSDDDPGLVRLFPPAYLDDAARDTEYHRLMREELVTRKLESLAVVEATADAERLTEDQLTAWLKVLNDLRLVIGTRLDVQEDEGPAAAPAPDDPSAPLVGLYWFLSYLLEAAVDALSRSR